MKILVCGGRKYGYKLENSRWIKDTDVWNKGIDLIKTYNPTTIISGKAKGGDELGEDAAKVLGITIEGYPADWDKHGKAAGHIRNQQMLDEGKPDLVIAFSGGKGTENMISRSKKAGVEVVEVEEYNE